MKAVSGRTDLRCLLGVVLIPLLLAGCDSTPKKHTFKWKPYENSIGRVAAHGDTFDVKGEIESVAASIDDAKKHSVALPPGVRVHMAYLLLLDGNGSAARQLLDEEKREYPESGHFVDRLIVQLEKAKSRQESQ